MDKCCISTCTNKYVKYNTLLQFYDFPVDSQLKEIWLNKCGIKSLTNTDLSSLKVCSEHFMQDDFEESFNNDYKKTLKYAAIPSYKIPGTNPIPPYELIKQHVDASTTLTKQFIKLKREKTRLLRKIKLHEEKLKIRKGNFKMLKSKIDRLRFHPAIEADKVSLLSKVFSDAQIEVFMGERKVIWSDDDLAMAFSLRQMSSKDCYLYMKRFLNFPLPALASVQKWASAKEI